MTDVTRGFAGPDGRVAALTDFSLTAEGRDFIAVRGPSGSGKSTMLLVAGALMRPEAGEVRIDDTDVYGLPPNRYQSASTVAPVGIPSEGGPGV